MKPKEIDAELERLKQLERRDLLRLASEHKILIVLEDQKADEEIRKILHVGMKEEFEAEAKYSHVKFRNYDPFDRVLRKRRLPDAPLPEISEIDDMLKALLTGNFQDHLSIIPKKSNWDLKRDVLGKLEKLDNRTQYAIYELIKAKVEAQGSSSSSGSSSSGSESGSESSDS